MLDAKLLELFGSEVLAEIAELGGPLKFFILITWCDDFSRFGRKQSGADFTKHKESMLWTTIALKVRHV